VTCLERPLTEERLAELTCTHPKAPQGGARKIGEDLEEVAAQYHRRLWRSTVSPTADASWRWSEAQSEFQRAIELNPKNATAHYFYAFSCLAPMNRMDQALEEHRTALSLDPLSSILNTNYAVLLIEARRFPESLAQFQKVLLGLGEPSSQKVFLSGGCETGKRVIAGQWLTGVENHPSLRAGLPLPRKQKWPGFNKHYPGGGGPGPRHRGKKIENDLNRPSTKKNMRRPGKKQMRPTGVHTISEEAMPIAVRIKELLRQAPNAPAMTARLCSTRM